MDDAESEAAEDEKGYSDGNADNGTGRHRVCAGALGLLENVLGRSCDVDCVCGEERTAEAQDDSRFGLLLTPSLECDQY